MRGLTYRASVVPAGREKIMKSIFYIGLLGSFDAALRRIGQLFLVFPKTERSAFLLRLLCLHVPWAIWALRGPLSERGSTRDDRGWSDTVTRSRLWRIISAAFGHAQIVLSEEWRQLSPSEIRHWMDRHYARGSLVSLVTSWKSTPTSHLRPMPQDSKSLEVIGMHPHGLLPVGAILAGLTWAPRRHGGPLLEGERCHGQSQLSLPVYAVRHYPARSLAATRSANCYVRAYEHGVSWGAQATAPEAGGGLRGRTASGVELPEPARPGSQGMLAGHGFDVVNGSCTELSASLGECSGTGERR